MNISKKARLIVMCLSFGCTTFIGAHCESVNIPVREPVKNQTGLYKVPILRPTVFYDDQTLTFDSSCIGCTIELVQNGEIVFTTVVDFNGEVEIPDNLNGLIELRIYRGLTFVGEFEP